MKKFLLMWIAMLMAVCLVIVTASFVLQKFGSHGLTLFVVCAAILAITGMIASVYSE